MQVEKLTTTFGTKVICLRPNRQYRSIKEVVGLHLYRQVLLLVYVGDDDLVLLHLLLLSGQPLGKGGEGLVRAPSALLVRDQLLDLYLIQYYPLELHVFGVAAW